MTDTPMFDSTHNSDEIRQILNTRPPTAEEMLERYPAKGNGRRQRKQVPKQRGGEGE